MGLSFKKIVLVLLVFLNVSVVDWAMAANECNRECLENHVNQYMAALMAHDSSRLPLAENVRFTENIFETTLDRGLWNTVTGMGSFRIYVADPMTGQVGFIGVVYEHDKAGLFSLRLKIESQLITEIETMHSRGNFFSMETLDTPRSAFSEGVINSERSSRQEMLAAAVAYGDSVVHNDGALAPFSTECERHENGMQTTGVSFANPEEPGPGCAAQMSSGAFDNTDKVSDRRFPIIDEERGLVMGYFVFQLPGMKTANREAQAPFSGPVTEIFKIRNGEIHEVEAVLMPTLPYGAGTGWK